MGRLQERGFNFNKQIVNDNINSKIVAVQCTVLDHMMSHEIKSHQFEITSRLMRHVKYAWKNYFLEQKERQCCLQNPIHSSYYSKI